VNRSGFHSRRQNSWNWSSSVTRWGQPGHVVLRRGPRAKDFWEGRERENLREHT
jgi:hypothetical protein